ncbi:MAG: TonB-dependent receptor [Myxococcota bacterium]
MSQRRVGFRASDAFTALALGVTLFCVNARAAEFPESADDRSAFSTVINARDYDDRFATVEELLDQVPGVRVRRFGGLGAYSTATIRGAKAEQVLVLLDGVRMNDATRGATDLSSLPLRQVERIEVLRGAGAQRYGSDAVGGVISITTRRPESADLAADASFSVGRYDTLGGDLAVSGGGESARGLASYSRLRSDNDFAFDVLPPGDSARPGVVSDATHVRLNAGFVEDAGLLRGSLDTGPHSRIDGTLDLYRRDSGEPGSILGKPLFDTTDEQLSCTGPSQSGDRGVARLAWSSDSLGEHGAAGALEVAASSREETGLLHDPAGACGLINTFVTNGRDESSWREGSSALDGRWRWHELDWDWLRLRGQFASGLRYDTVDTTDSELERRTTGLLSLQPELSLLEESLRIFPALAWEAASTSSGLVRAAASQPMVPFQPHDETAWLPGVGAILQLTPGLRLKANLKRVMRRPNFTELFHPDWGTIRGNPTLEAERGWNADAGFELAAPGAGIVRDVRAEADVFQREIDQSIEWLSTTSNVIMPMNTGPARALGAEASLGGRFFERLTLDASYTYTDAHYLGSGPGGAALVLHPDLRFPHVPEHAVDLRSDLDLGALRVWSELRYESEILFAVGNTIALPAALQVDAGLTLYPRLIPGFHFFPANGSIAIEGTNLTGEQRFDSLGLPLPKQALWLVRLRMATP